MKSPNIEATIRIFYAHTEINNKEIREIFGAVSSATIVKLKKQAREVMLESGCKTWDANAVHTRCAYQAWSIDVSDLEARWSKLKKLGFVKTGEATQAS